MPYTEINSEITTTTTEASDYFGSVVEFGLVFHKEVSPSQRKGIARLLSAHSRDAQMIVHELTGRIELTRVDNPIGYIKGILENIGEEGFQPELALAVADRLEQRRKLEEKRRETAREKEVSRKCRRSCGEVSKHMQDIRKILPKGGRK